MPNSETLESLRPNTADSHSDGDKQNDEHNGSKENLASSSSSQKERVRSDGPKHGKHEPHRSDSLKDDDGKNKPLSEGFSSWLSSFSGSPAEKDESRTITEAELLALRERAIEAKVVDEVSEELSLALGIAQRIRNGEVEIADATQRISFLFDCLLSEPARLILARDERLRLQYEIYGQAGPLSRFLAWISAGSSASLVLAALLVSLFCWTIVVLLINFAVHKITSDLINSIFFMDGKILAVTASAAFIGGVVSIATRLREFARIRDIDPFAMFWTATLKPLIGVVLSVFLLATLAGKVISFSFLGTEPFAFLIDAEKTLGSQTLYALWMLAFLAGFSERFAYDFVDRAQGVAGGTHSPPQEKGSSQG